jgi:aspartate/methionine/tyrosine aminotransferase
VIVVNGFSKEFAMTGWRLGYTVSSKKFTDLMVRFAENTVTCPTSFVQKAAVTALTAPRDWFRNMLDEYHARRDLMIEEVRKISGWQANVPEGAFYCFPRTNIKDSRTFEKTLLEKKRVSLVAGVHFGLNGERHVRLSYTTSRDNIRQGMNLLRQYVDEHSD